MSKEGYQPLKTKRTIKIIPPNTGSNVRMKKDGYTWEDLDKAWWEGFDNAENKMKKRIEELEEENARLRRKAENLQKYLDNQNSYRECAETWEKLTKAKELIEKLSKSLFLAKGIVRDLIDDTVSVNESKERAIYCYEQKHFDTYKEAEQFLNSEVGK